METLDFAEMTDISKLEANCQKLKAVDRFPSLLIHQGENEYVMIGKVSEVC